MSALGEMARMASFLATERILQKAEPGAARAEAASIFLASDHSCTSVGPSSMRQDAGAVRPCY
jgi:hypothetical protein